MSGIEETAETFIVETEDGEGERGNDAVVDADGDGEDNGDDDEDWLLKHFDLRMSRKSLSKVESGTPVPLKLLSRLWKNLQWIIPVLCAPGKSKR